MDGAGSGSWRFPDFYITLRAFLTQIWFISQTDSEVRDLEWEVVGNGCPMAGFGIKNVESWGSANLM